MTWIQTYHGRQLDILPSAFDADQIDFADIARALPHINRYAGHTPYPYSVAQHSIVLARSFQRQRHVIQIGGPVVEGDHMTRVEELRVLERWAFIHDWGEYAIGDLPGPFKAHAPDLIRLEDRIVGALAERYGLPAQMPREVKEMDRRLCRNEMDALALPEAPRWWSGLAPVPFVDPADFRERSVADVRAEFLAIADRLGLSFLRPRRAALC